MIDLLTVNYRNYELLDFQLEHLSRLDGINDCNLIVVDNTPIGERRRISHPLISNIVYTDAEPNFDGISHGNAIDIGMRRVKSDLVFLFDTDYFILSKDFFPRFISIMIKNDYDAMGAEFFDGRDWMPMRNMFPERFDGIPAPWGSFYKSKLAKSESWVITPEELKNNYAEGFIEVGWRIRMNLINRGKNTLAFKGFQKNYAGQGNCYFSYDEETIGFHYMRASYDRMIDSMDEIKRIIT